MLARAVLFLFSVIETNVLRGNSTSEFSHSLGHKRTFDPSLLRVRSIRAACRASVRRFVRARLGCQRPARRAGLWVRRRLSPSRFPVSDRPSRRRIRFAGPVFRFSQNPVLGFRLGREVSDMRIRTIPRLYRNEPAAFFLSLVQTATLPQYATFSLAHHMLKNILG